jgi:hypothetical protein
MTSDDRIPIPLDPHRWVKQLTVDLARVFNALAHEGYTLAIGVNGVVITKDGETIATARVGTDDDGSSRWIGTE